MSEHRCPICGGAPHITKAKLKVYRYTCLDCDRRRIKAWKSANREKVSTYQRAWNDAHPEARKTWKRTQHVLPDPTKVHARTVVGNAIKSGKLIKQPCRVCGAAKAQAHHEDYSRPLDVEWLCPKCHKRHHLQRQSA